MKRNDALYKLVITAIFSALACVGTFINIPMPSGGMVHLGNFVMVLAAVLCGGLVGGLSGSIGMGLCDIFLGYPPSTYLRSFVLKFIIGFAVGYLFRLIIKKKKDPKLYSYIMSFIFLALGIVGIVLATKVNGGVVNIKAFNASKTIESGSLIVSIVFSFIFSLGLFLASLFSKKLKGGSKVCLFAVSVGMILNMVLELILRTLLTHLIDGVDTNVAFVTALAKIPASIITSLITVILATLLYYPTYNAVKELNHLNNIDEIDEYDNLEASI